MNDRGLLECAQGRSESSVLVTPLHEHFSPAHLERVIAEMRRRGAPVLRGTFDAVSGAWLMREGTHRLRAAKVLGVVPVLVPVRWQKGRAALSRARFAVAERSHLFERVEVRPVTTGSTPK